MDIDCLQLKIIHMTKWHIWGGRYAPIHDQADHFTRFLSNDFLLKTSSTFYFRYLTYLCFCSMSSSVISP